MHSPVLGDRRLPGPHFLRQRLVLRFLVNPDLHLLPDLVRWELDRDFDLWELDRDFDLRELDFFW
jgi:hypothetical protein